jgi:hypothetical protein
MKQIIIPSALPDQRQAAAALAQKLGCDIMDILPLPYIRDGKVMYAQSKFLTETIANTK